MDVLPPSGQPLAIFCEFEAIVSSLHTEAVFFSTEGSDLKMASTRLASTTSRGARTLAYEGLQVATLQEATDRLEAAGVVLAPGFEDFAELCSIRQVRLYILTHGLKPVVRHFLRKAGLGHIEVLGNDLSIGDDGAWRVLFRDDSPSGHDKGESLQRALVGRQSPAKVVFIGTLADDFSAVETGRIHTLYTPPGSSLAQRCSQAGLGTRPFESWVALVDELQL